ncbi:MAG: NFYB/HAP3 family transcription factor subunit [Candidatus Micrarchaeia archaeon]
MVEEEAEREAVEGSVESEELPPEEEEKLPFPTARIVRIMKEHMTKPHQIRAEVKVAVNEFLGDILKDVAQEMDKEEVFTLGTEHFNKAVKKYKMIEYQQKRIDRIKKLLEKQRAEIDEVVTEIDLTREL